MKPINMAAEPSCAKIIARLRRPKTWSGGRRRAAERRRVSEGRFQPVFICHRHLSGNDRSEGLPVYASCSGPDGRPAAEVTNSDQTTHNIHPVPKNNREWNQSQPPGSAPLKQTFAREEIAIPVKCNVHPWMKSYIAVFSNPYFQVTGKDGKFTLKNVPPGTYTLTAWHESLGQWTRW